MKNVKEAANARAVLGCYHPLWLRLGAEVVIGKAAAGASVALARALVVVMSAYGIGLGWCPVATSPAG